MTEKSSGFPLIEMVFVAHMKPKVTRRKSSPPIGGKTFQLMLNIKSVEQNKAALCLEDVGNDVHLQPVLIQSSANRDIWSHPSASPTIAPYHNF